MSGEENTAPLTEEQRAAKAVEAAQAHRDKFAKSADDGRETPVKADDSPAHVKPDHVPEKFWNKDTGEVNYEAWNTAHAALESKFHAGSKDAEGESKETPAPDKDAADGDSSKEETKDETATKEILETPVAQAAAAEYAENQELSDDTYAKLEKQGITRDMVDTYIEGQQAKANVLTNAAFEPAGGAERYAEMVQWAAANLDEPSKKAFNTQVTSGDPDVIRNAVTALANVYGETETVEGERTGGSPPANNSSTFASRKEMTDAINKLGADGRRLYDTDPAYRTEVARKIGKSRERGTVNF